VTSNFWPEVEIRPFHAFAMHPAIIVGKVSSLRTSRWGRYHVPHFVWHVWCLLYLFVTCVAFIGIICTWVLLCLFFHLFAHCFVLCITVQAVLCSLLLQRVAPKNLNHLRLRQKISLSMMTSQDRICVQCVTNGLWGNMIWADTNRFITQRTCIRAVSARNVFQHRTHLLRTTTDFTAVSYRTSVRYVKRCLRTPDSWRDTWLFIRDRNRTNVARVTRRLVSPEVSAGTWESTREINHTSVHCVTKVSVISAACGDIDVKYTRRVNHITVLTVGRCLRQTVTWSVMFIFTLVQSRTHVDTVQSVLPVMTNSRHICWSHTTKVINGVTFMCRNKHTYTPVADPGI